MKLAALLFGIAALVGNIICVRQFREDRQQSAAYFTRIEDFIFKLEGAGFSKIEFDSFLQEFKSSRKQYYVGQTPAVLTANAANISGFLSLGCIVVALRSLKTKSA